MKCKIIIDVEEGTGDMEKKNGEVVIMTRNSVSNVSC